MSRLRSCDLIEKINTGNPVVLAVDTNIDHASPKNVIDLANQVNRLRFKGIKIYLVVPAIVVAEREAQVRREKKDKYDENIVRSFFKSKAEIAPFDDSTAFLAAQWLATAIVTSDDWKNSKWKAFCEQFKSEAEIYQRLIQHPKRISMTTDWLIAAQAASQGWIVLTEDKGKEWNNVMHISAIDAIKALEVCLSLQTSG